MQISLIIPPWPSNLLNSFFGEWLAKWLTWPNVNASWEDVMNLSTFQCPTSPVVLTPFRWMCHIYSLSGLLINILLPLSCFHKKIHGRRGLYCFRPLQWSHCLCNYGLLFELVFSFKEQYHLTQNGGHWGPMKEGCYVLPTHIYCTSAEQRRFIDVLFHFGKLHNSDSGSVHGCAYLSNNSAEDLTSAPSAVVHKDQAALGL